MNLLLLSGRILLAIVFASAAAGKAFDAAGSQKALAEFGFPQLLIRPAGFLLPIAELMTAILLLSTSTAFWGAAAAFALLLAFAVAIIVNLVNGRKPECHCFGQFHSRPISWALVTRNLTLAIGAAVILWEGPGMSFAAGSRGFAEIARARPLPMAAASLAVVAFIVEAFLLLALFQQHGRLMLRTDKLEQRAEERGSLGLIAPAVAGLSVGVPAPSFELSSPNGRVPLETLLSGGSPVLLVFTAPDCPACVALLPDIERWETQFAEMVTIVVISRASASANGRPSAEYVFRNMAWQKDHEISESYKIGGVPAAVLVRQDATIGTWLATGRVAIHSLVMLYLYMRMLVPTKEAIG